MNRSGDVQFHLLSKFIIYGSLCIFSVVFAQNRILFPYIQKENKQKTKTII